MGWPIIAAPLGGLYIGAEGAKEKNLFFIGIYMSRAPFYKGFLGAEGARSFSA